MMDHPTPAAYAAAVLAVRSADPEPAGRRCRLERDTWYSRTLGNDRRVDLFMPDGAADAGTGNRLLVVLDGADFVDVMRLPAILGRLVASGRIPWTAALYIDHPDWSTRNRELMDESFVDVLADEMLPDLASRLGVTPLAQRTTVLGASAGAIAATRAALYRPDRFEGAVALSGPWTEHLRVPAGTGRSRHPARFFLYAGREEELTILSDGASLLDATRRTGRDLRALGHTVRCTYGEGGHTYAAWQAILPEAVTWMLATRP